MSEPDGGPVQAGDAGGLRRVLGSGSHTELVRPLPICDPFLMGRHAEQIAYDWETPGPGRIG